jgi:hypothetical protein
MDSCPAEAPPPFNTTKKCNTNGCNIRIPLDYSYCRCDKLVTSDKPATGKIKRTAGRELLPLPRQILAGLHLRSEEELRLAVPMADLRLGHGQITPAKTTQIREMLVKKTRMTTSVGTARRMRMG